MDGNLEKQREMAKYFASLFSSQIILLSNNPKRIFGMNATIENVAVFFGLSIFHIKAFIKR